MPSGTMRLGVRRRMRFSTERHGGGGAGEWALRYWEESRLRTAVVVVGWVAACALISGGVALMVVFPDTLVEGLGALSAMIGVVVAAGLVRCRRFEVSVVGGALRFGTGPFVRRVIVDEVRGFDVRLATGFRRAYGEREAELALDRGSVAVPSSDPETLAEVLFEESRD